MTKNELIYREFVERYPLSNANEKKHIEHSICDYLLKFHKIKIERAAYAGRLYPELLILDRTRNIFGYLSIQHYVDEAFNADSQEDFDRRIRKGIQVYYSELDRPVFFLYWYSSKGSDGIYYLTSEQVQDILVNKRNNNDYTPFYPQKELMGDFVEFIATVKKNT